MKLWAYGDSFVAGDQDIPNRVDAIFEHTEYNRYNISFASHLARSLGIELINRGISGCSNFVQLDKLWLDAPSISKDDIVIFSLTTPWRDRFTIPHSCPELVADTRGPTLVHRELVNGSQNFSRVAIIDLFYVLSVIEKIEKLFNIRVVKFNAFHNAIAEAEDADKKLFTFDNFIDIDIAGNTLLDLLTEEWGKNKKTDPDHTKLKPPAKYLHLFTSKYHPSLEGHKLIAEWLENKLKEMEII